MIGKPLNLDPKTIKESLDPRNFVDYHAVTGGAAPSEAKRMAKARLTRLSDDEKAVSARREKLTSAKTKLRAALGKIINNDRNQ